jgi:hypothetical protein
LTCHPQGITFFPAFHCIEIAKEGVMALATTIFQQLADGRVSANLLTFYGLIVAAILAGLVLRALLAHGRSRLTDLKGLRWVQNIGQEAVPRLRFLITLLTLSI